MHVGLFSRLPCFLLGVSLSAALANASVSLSNSANVVAQGGSVTFTVTVSPEITVSNITLAYAGEAAQDQATSAPAVFTHTFDDTGTPTVTATVTDSNGNPAGQASVQVEVVNLILTGTFEPLRGWATTYFAETSPAGTLCDGFDWTFSWTGGANTYHDSDADADGKSLWGGRMVVNGTIRCTTVINGVVLSAQGQVIVTPRDWYTPITCVQDNEPEWGGEPTPGATLGMYRDRDSDLMDIFVPRNSTYNWDSAYAVTQVPSGPCIGWWYVSGCILRCQRETVINRYLKGNAPTLGGETFQTQNDRYQCFSTSTGNFVEAVRNHEYCGTPGTWKSPEGHFGRTQKYILDFNHDAKKNVERLAARNQQSLRVAVNDTIFGDEQAVEQYAGDESYAWTFGPNWGVDAGALGFGNGSRWMPDPGSWTDCVYGPSDF